MVYPPWALLKFDFKKILCKIPTGIAVIFFETPTLIWAKPDLWGLGGESWCMVGSLHYAKMILTLGDHFGIVKACYDAL